MKKTIVVALGGNAIKKADDKGTAEEQLENVDATCKHITEIIKRGFRIVLTHGNGPQAGNLLIQQEEANKTVPPQPLDIVGAMTQGQIGYMLQQALIKHLKKAGLDVPVVTVLTQAIVNEDDADFRNPSKPVGPFYTRREAERFVEEKGYDIKKVKPKGRKVYRRVVPSPAPFALVEQETIKRLVNDGVVVIAAGGGGIPVAVDESGDLHGVDAVIDKDLAGEVLAEVVGASVFLILTDIEKVRLDYGKPTEKSVDQMSLTEAKKYLREGHFLEGSMKPKIMACIRFLEFGGEKAIVTSLDKAVEALDEKTGTLITR